MRCVPKQMCSLKKASARGSKRIKIDSLKIVKELIYELRKISNVIETGNEKIATLISCFQHESNDVNKRMLVNSKFLKRKIAFDL